MSELRDLRDQLAAIIVAEIKKYPITDGHRFGGAIGWGATEHTIADAVLPFVGQKLAEQREDIARAIDHHRENNAGSFDRQYGLILAARMVRDFGREPT